MKKVFGFGLAVLLVCLSVSLSGCGGGAASGGGAAPAAGNSVTVNGVVTAQADDLSSIGASTLGLKSKATAAEKAFLLSKGVDETSIRVGNLIPLTASNTYVEIGPIDANGNIITAEAVTVAINADGSYSVTIPNYDSSKTYSARAYKVNAELGKTLEYTTILPTPTNGVVPTSEGAITAQTTLVAQMIVDQVVTVLQSAKVDPNVIATVKETIISAVNTLVQTGAITLNGIGVRATSAADNSTLANQARRAAADNNISQNLETVQNATLVADAIANHDLDKAKGVMNYLNSELWGGNAPKEILNAMASQLVAGTSISMGNLTTAANAATTGLTALTASTLSDLIKAKITAAYNSGDVVNLKSEASGRSNLEDEGVVVAIKMAFPKTQYLSGSTASGPSSSASLNIAQVMVVLALCEARAYDVSSAGQTSFNPGTFMFTALSGIAGALPAELSQTGIMGSSIRVIAFENWNNFQSSGPNSRPTAEAVLNVQAQVGNMANPSANLSGITVKLYYPKTGGIGTANLRQQQMGMGGAPMEQSLAAQAIQTRQVAIQAGEGEQGMGMLSFSLDPWFNIGSSNGTGDASSYIVNNFIAGTYTLEAKQNGTVIDTQTIYFPAISLTREVTLVKPKAAGMSAQDLVNMTSFPSREVPEFSWSIGTLPALPSTNYTYAYAVQIVRGTIEAGGPGGDIWFQAQYWNQNSRVFTSWEKNKFPAAAANTTTIFKLPGTGTLESGIYELSVSLIVLDKNTKQPIAEGTMNHTIFSVGTVSLPAGAGNQYNQAWQQVSSGTSLASVLATLEVKVHTNVFTWMGNGTPLSTLKIGLFTETSTQSSTGMWMQSYSHVPEMALPTIASTDAVNNYVTVTFEVQGSRLLSALNGANNRTFRFIVWSDTASQEDVIDMPTDTNNNGMIDGSEFAGTERWQSCDTFFSVNSWGGNNGDIKVNGANNPSGQVVFGGDLSQNANVWYIPSWTVMTP